MCEQSVKSNCKICNLYLVLYRNKLIIELMSCTVISISIVFPKFYFVGKNAGAFIHQNVILLLPSD